MRVLEQNKTILKNQKRGLGPRFFSFKAALNGYGTGYY
jgi:hypothetical protein